MRSTSLFVTRPPLRSRETASSFTPVFARHVSGRWCGAHVRVRLSRRAARRGAVGRGRLPRRLRSVAAAAPATRIERREHFANLYVRAFGVFDGREHPGAVGADFEVDLLGLELDQRVAQVDMVAFFLQPLGDARFHHRLAQFGHDDVGHRLSQVTITSYKLQVLYVVPTT